MSEAATDLFEHRHLGPRPADVDRMLDVVGAPSLGALVDQAVPAGIRLPRPLDLPDAEPEAQYLDRLRAVGARNEGWRSFIGQGYYDCVTPSVILRNVLENPGWYTPYTPYQAEAAQGRLEALLNFQTMVEDLAAMDVANASLLDEATAAAEAMTLAHRIRARRPGTANRFVVAASCFPQTVAVVRGRAEPLGIEVVVADPDALDRAIVGAGGATFGVLVQSPDTYGSVWDVGGVAGRAHEAGALVIVASDLLALTLVRPPGEMGADVVVGNAQRFGVPMGYGGPHAAFFATRSEYVRQMPGRLIGVSVDAHGRPAYRMALQTREQHIRRERATSNICTAQALLANVAAFYAVYHGATGLARIAARVHGLACGLAGRLDALGFVRRAGAFFDTITVRDASDARVPLVRQLAERARINLCYHPDVRYRDRLRRDVERRRRRGAGQSVRGGGGVRRRTGGERPAAARRPPGTAPPLDAVPDPSGLQPAPFRAADDAVPAPARTEGHRARPVDDPARVMHDEAQRRRRAPPGNLAGVRPAAPLRPGRAGRRLQPGDRRARARPPRDHRLRRRVPAAQLGRPGRACRPARDSRLPSRPRGDGARRRADSGIRPWHQSGERRHGRNARRRRRLCRERRRRPCRPAGEGAGAPRPPERAHGHLPVDARGVRGRDHRDLRGGARARRSGVHGRRQHERPGRV